MAAALWKAADAAAATGGTAGGDWQCADIAIDSRECAPGDLFVALKGEHSDGHAYLGDVFAREAAAAMVSREVADWPPAVGCLRVGDTLTGLRGLARAARKRCRGAIVAVTGSVGKTGVKEGLRSVLSAQGRAHANIRSFNNHVGAPLSLARLPVDADFGIFELGMSHAGEIAPLAALVRPDCALITNIAPAHAGFFDSLEDIARAKAEIFTGMALGGTAVLNRDDGSFGLLERLAIDAGVGRIISFGTHEEADVRAERFHLHPHLSCVQARVSGHALTYKSGLAGYHWVLNSLAVLAVVEALGADIGLAGLALANLSAPPRRGNRHRVGWAGGTITLIDETYNANPASMTAALGVLGGLEPGPHGRRIAVLGEMLELGAGAVEAHKALSAPIEAAAIDMVITVGGLGTALDDVLPPACHAGHAEDALQALSLIERIVRPGDIVLVKGSNALGLSRIIEKLVADNAPTTAGSSPQRAVAGGRG